MRYTAWHHRLSAENYAEVLAVRDAYRAGELGVTARSIAVAILNDFKARGIPACSLHTLNQWLLHG